MRRFGHTPGNALQDEERPVPVLDSTDWHEQARADSTIVKTLGTRMAVTKMTMMMTISIASPPVNEDIGPFTLYPKRGL